mmetsp:Transcript_42581/g.100195  ORF Transcript_42581/g.100195 Transcript_42581/m.100195 type:complete len:201 (-) Transcript_42581:865-1467(-)
MAFRRVIAQAVDVGQLGRTDTGTPTATGPRHGRKSQADARSQRRTRHHATAGETCGGCADATPWERMLASRSEHSRLLWSHHPRSIHHPSLSRHRHRRFSPCGRGLLSRRPTLRPPQPRSRPSPSPHRRPQTFSSRWTLVVCCGEWDARPLSSRWSRLTSSQLAAPRSSRQTRYLVASSRRRCTSSSPAGRRGRGEDDGS